MSSPPFDSSAHEFTDMGGGGGGGFENKYILFSPTINKIILTDEYLLTITCLHASEVQRSV